MKTQLKIIILLFSFLSCISWGEERPRALTINLEKTPKAPASKAKPTGPVILDARPAFEYATGHAVNSSLIRWQDYSQNEGSHKLDPDFDLLARKLRILGVSPSRKVIVIGDGPSGAGEEGRIAWMLNFLGVKDVEVTNFQNLKGRRSLDEPHDRESVPVWLPHPETSLRIEKRELEKIVLEKTGSVVDVRNPADFQGHIRGAVNIPIKLFFNSEGDSMGSDNIVRVLKEHGVDTKQPIIFYSQDGLASATATFLAHRANLVARHYDGTFNEWITDPSGPTN